MHRLFSSAQRYGKIFFYFYVYFYHGFIFSGKGKSPDRFDDNLIILQEEAATNGLDNSDIKVIADVIRRNELRELNFQRGFFLFKNNNNNIWIY